MAAHGFGRHAVSFFYRSCKSRMRVGRTLGFGAIGVVARDVGGVWSVRRLASGMRSHGAQRIGTAAREADFGLGRVFVVAE